MERRSISNFGYVTFSGFKLAQYPTNTVRPSTYYNDMNLGADTNTNTDSPFYPYKTASSAFFGRNCESAFAPATNTATSLWAQDNKVLKTNATETLRTILGLATSPVSNSTGSVSTETGTPLPMPEEKQQYAISKQIKTTLGVAEIENKYDDFMFFTGKTIHSGEAAPNTTLCHVNKAATDEIKKILGILTCKIIPNTFEKSLVISKKTDSPQFTPFVYSDHEDKAGTVIMKWILGIPQSQGPYSYFEE
ncbi:hypothetical protein JCM33374_g5329 [Metschnikowia sp. JCM 33374]|nr:hypothetical protein JCM33374_g5329 [Metschnikowia sp. JCM 33374]